MPQFPHWKTGMIYHSFKWVTPGESCSRHHATICKIIKKLLSHDLQCRRQYFICCPKRMLHFIASSPPTSSPMVYTSGVYLSSAFTESSLSALWASGKDRATQLEAGTSCLQRKASRGRKGVLAHSVALPLLTFTETFKFQFVNWLVRNDWKCYPGTGESRLFCFALFHPLDILIFHSYWPGNLPQIFQICNDSLSSLFFNVFQSKSSYLLNVDGSFFFPALFVKGKTNAFKNHNFLSDIVQRFSVALLFLDIFLC